MKSFIGLTPEETSLSAKYLSKLLANTYLLALKTQNYHWNVKDPSFIMLHEFFGSHYEELSEVIDEVAERIQMIGHKTPATFSQFLELTSLSEETAAQTRVDMVEDLLKGHETIIIELREMLQALDKSNDEGTIDFFIGRLRAHEKMSWMLRSHVTK
jgi:starvation-inducible DNA-binding protein